MELGPIRAGGGAKRPLLRVRVQMCMENHAFGIFGALVDCLRKQPNWKFPQVKPMHQKIQKHDFPCTFAPLLNHFRSEKIWSKLGQVWSKFDQFLTQFFCPFTSKWDLAKSIGSPSFSCLDQTVQKLFHFMRLNASRPISL